MTVDRAQESRRRILESARQIFFRDGFEAANLDDVALSAGLAKGTIYRHFESKAELYVAVLARNADAFVERMRQTLDPSLSAEEQIWRTGFFLLVGLCLAVIASLFIARKMVTPIQSLQASAAQIGGGDLDRASIFARGTNWRSSLRSLTG